MDSCVAQTQIPREYGILFFSLPKAFVSGYVITSSCLTSNGIGCLLMDIFFHRKYTRMHTDTHTEIYIGKHTHTHTILNKRKKPKMKFKCWAVCQCISEINTCNEPLWKVRSQNVKTVNAKTLLFSYCILWCLKYGENILSAMTHVSEDGSSFHTKIKCWKGMENWNETTI